MTSMVVLGLSIATVLLLLGAFLATMRQDRRGRASAPPPVEVAPVETPLPAPVDAPGHAVTDYADPRTIQVGDRIEVHGTPSRVLGAMYVSWQGQQWTEYLLRDAVRRRLWLSVEVREGKSPGEPSHLEVLLWTEVPTQGMVPAKSMLIMEGVEFFPIQRGTAAFRSEGETGTPERGLLDFADYHASDGRLLSFERVQGHSWTASYAQPLPPGSITIVTRAT
ncbi:MAG: DUF4178 domain-containing protein [Nonomuraea sp.]|nr:DUF4178 domain-containing protein [Nonomuraea sp.]NUP68606.1 DUF4178 domain-containing protein [Nonomuraea sp.]NUP78275.1 DUF4178 domain-containing protein [Nonomuraea sp.]NUS05545.1 DUF4178 domain-containing protein [Nonomuraea sp.]NUT09681.1 DUF4178 domain-containing protein [Nonomuraea sp.]